MAKRRRRLRRVNPIEQVFDDLIGEAQQRIADSIRQVLSPTKPPESLKLARMEPVADSPRIMRPHAKPVIKDAEFTIIKKNP